MCMKINEVVVDTPEKLGEAIKLHRLIRGWKQTDVARLAGVTRQTVATVESGAPGVRLVSVLSIMKALNMPMMKTLVGEGE